MGDKLIVIGEFEPYVGYRGYQKERAPIYIQTGGETGPKQNIGVVKVEPVLNAAGELITTLVYARVGGALAIPKGQPWLFASKRALVQNFQNRLNETSGSSLEKTFKKASNFVELDADDAEDAMSKA